MSSKDSRLVRVFKTDDPGVLPLATLALEGEGIDHVVHNEGKVDSLDWAMSQPPTIRPRVVEILVTADDAARARDLLADLEQAATAPITTADPPSITLENAETGATVGAITESQLQELTSRLEEDAPQQYRITRDAVAELDHAGADTALVALLRQAVGADGSGCVIRWVVR